MNSDVIINSFDEIFNDKKCNELCRRCKFIKRSSSKIQGADFIKLMILPAEGVTRDSLSGLVKRMREFNADANISAQALCKRINSASSRLLMQTLFGELLMHSALKLIKKSSNLESILGLFIKVFIQDSTLITLNKKLNNAYPGFNKANDKNVKAKAKVDLIYEVLTGRIIEANIHGGITPDQSLTEEILKHLEPGNLVLRDLGYFKIDTFKKIGEIGAYWISRYQPGVNLYLEKEDNKVLDIGKYLQENHLDRNIIELMVFLGDDRIECRVILYRQPKEIIEERLRIANKDAKRNGRTLSKSKKISLMYAIFLTNIPFILLEAKVIGTIYRLRWEIELIFKRWKSQLEIDYIPGSNKNRIDSLIFGRLCMMVILEIVTGYVSSIAERQFKQEISEVKIINYLLREGKFKTAISNNKIELFLKELEEDISRMLLKNTRTSKTMRERIKNEENYYNTEVFVNQEVA